MGHQDDELSDVVVIIVDEAGMTTAGCRGEAEVGWAGGFGY